MATTSVTIAVTGTAGATIEAFTRLPGGAAISGGTRVGSGNITIPNLTIGLIYEIFSQEQTAGGNFGQPSQSIFVLVVATADTPATPIAAFIDKIRDHFTNQVAFLAWINSIDGLETTSGHVFLGYKPTRIKQNFLRDKGPVLAIKYSADTLTAASGKTAIGSVTAEVDIFWYEDPDVPDVSINATNFLGKMLHEVWNIGIPFDDNPNTDFGSNLASTDREAFIVDLDRPAVRQMTWTLEVTLGSDDAS